jgi:hypothetical protein
MLGFVLTLAAAFMGSDAPSTPLRVEVRCPSAPVASGEPVPLTLVVTNTSDAPVALHFNSSQRFDFELRSASGMSVWSWASERVFLQVLGMETIAPNRSLEYTDKYIGGLPAGSYQVIGRVTSREPMPPATCTLTLR